MNSNAVMFMQKKNAETVLQDSTAAADVRQTPIISMEILMMHMILAVNCRKSVIECAIMIKAAEAEMEVKRMKKRKES